MNAKSDFEIKRADLKKIREEYLDERRIYIEAEHKAIGGFSRALLTLSAGALGFSLTYIRTAVETPKYTGWLLATWIFFALALLITTAALYSSHAAFREGRSILREEYKARERDYLENYGEPPENHVETKVDKENKASEETRVFNRLSFGLFICGSITLVIFVSLNLS